MKKTLLNIAIAVILLGLLSSLFLLKEEEVSVENREVNSGLREQWLEVSGNRILAEVAETPKQREIGLSNRRTPLKEGEGMLFVFEKDGRYGFWMKDTHFPIDIVWITDEKQITHIEENVRPESYPEVFQPKEPARFVLEIPAGYTQKQGIQVGDKVLWVLKAKRE